MDMDNMHSTTTSTMVMEMSLFWGKDVTILLSSWTTATIGQYMAAILAVFLFCVLHEFLTTVRITVIANATQSTVKSVDSPGNATLLLLQRYTGPFPIGSKLTGSLLYGVNVASSYLIMLVVMTFNIGLLGAVVLGLTAGFLVFGFGRSAPPSSTQHPV